jgi:sugar phosphate isomerase/epimerase
MLREIREMGFEYAELSHGIRLSLMPGILDAVQKGEIKISTLHNFCPLPIGVNHPSPNLFKFSSSNKKEREYAWKHSVKTIETAAALGAKLVVLHTGEIDMKSYQEKLEKMVTKGLRETPKYRALVEEMETKREKRKEEAMNNAREMIAELAYLAARKGLLLGIENREAVEEIPIDHEMGFFLGELPENARYWHDCGHAQIKELMGLMDHRLHLENLAPRLAGFHIHDVTVTEDGLHDHQPPGTGVIDYAALKPVVKPEHIKVIELSPGLHPEDVRRGVAHIKSIWGEE